MNYKIGQTFKGTYPPEAAVWCNANNAHIEVLDGVYTIVENAPTLEPTTEKRVQALENETGLTRAIREVVLSGDVTVSKYVIDKATEIEALAEQLRTTEETSATGKETLQVEETEMVDEEETK